MNQSPPSAVITPLRGHRSPSVESLMNLVRFWSIFQANLAGSVSTPSLLSRTAIIESGSSWPWTLHEPINFGACFECGGDFRTSRTISFSSSKSYSSPQIFQEIRKSRSEISVPPRSLSPRFLCLSSITMTRSFFIVRPMSSAGMSEPHRTALKPSAAHMPLWQKNKRTSIELLRSICIRIYITIGPNKQYTKLVFSVPLSG